MVSFIIELENCKVRITKHLESCFFFFFIVCFQPMNLRISFKKLSVPSGFVWYRCLEVKYREPSVSRVLHLLFKLKATKRYSWHLMITEKRGCKNKIVVGLSHEITKFSGQFFADMLYMFGS